GKRALRWLRWGRSARARLWRTCPIPRRIGAATSSVGSTTARSGSTVWTRFCSHASVDHLEALGNSSRLESLPQCGACLCRKPARVRIVDELLDRARDLTRFRVHEASTPTG